MEKKVATIIVLVLLGTLTQGVNVVTASSTGWSKTYGEGTGHVVVKTSDGGFAVAGTTYGGADFWLIKTDNQGNVQWNHTYGKHSSENAKALIETADGGFALAGYSGTDDCWLVKTDSLGNMEWNQTYGGKGIDFANSLIQTSDGGYALAGSFSLNYTDPFDNRQFWLIKTDSFGNMEWNKTYGEAGYNYANSLVEAHDGGYLLVGNMDIYLVVATSWIAKTDEQGNMEWNKKFDAKDYLGANSVIKTSDGCYAVAGYRAEDVWLIKIDQNGTLEWEQTYSNGKAYSVVETSDGGYALAGCVKTGNLETTKGLLVKTDPMGNKIWEQTYESPENQYIYSLIENSDETFVLAGYKNSEYPNPPELWLIKTDEQGIIPEFSSWTSLLFVSVTALIAIVGYRKKLQNQGGQKCHLR